MHVQNDFTRVQHFFGVMVCVLMAMVGYGCSQPVIQPGKDEVSNVDVPGAVQMFGMRLEGKVSRFSTLHANYMGTCALDMEKEIYCWGAGFTDDVPSGRFEQVVVGFDDPCALDSEGIVTCWTYHSRPDQRLIHGRYREITSGHGWFGITVDGEIRIRLSREHVVVREPGTNQWYRQLSAHGGAVCWIVEPEKEIECTGEYEIPEGSYVELTCHNHHCCAIDTAARLSCFGYDAYGVLEPPVGEFSNVSAGWFHSCAIDTSGKIHCWGLNDSGQASPPAGEFKEVSAGWFHSCALDLEGRLFCWGAEEIFR